jgi:hypothetical protein
LNQRDVASSRMNIRNLTYKIVNRTLIALHLRPRLDALSTYSFGPDQQQIFQTQAKPGSVAGAFFENRGRPVDKWHHYLDIYDRHFSQFKERPIFFLEIGVCDGGSLDMWRRYFGDQAVIVGIDIDEQCAKRVDAPNVVRIGSQDDLKFLQGIISEFGNPDVVLDDGSHLGAHQRASFDALFDVVKNDGLYVIEDLHTSYWTGWEGGFRRRNTGIEFVKQMIDDVHGWYHKRPKGVVSGDMVGGVHLYDSIVVIEKTKRQRPGRLHGGTRP